MRPRKVILVLMTILFILGLLKFCIQPSTINKSTPDITTTHAPPNTVKHKSDPVCGFVISSSFWEQQVGAALNLWALSQWSKTVGVYPVEPFVVQSKFVLPKCVSDISGLLRFRDYFDIQHWNKISADLQLMPLISWESFVQNKSSNLIVAIVILLDIHAGEKHSIGCDIKLKQFLASSAFKLASELNFKVVRKVCFMFAGNSTTVPKFNTKLYGEFNPKEVTVWFSLWPGINPFRIYFKEREYWRNNKPMNSILPSKRIIADSQRYVHDVIGTTFGNYIAVSFRSVKRAKRFQGSFSTSWQQKFFDTCITQIKKKINSLGSDGKVFLSMDLGRFGDASAVKYMHEDLINFILNNAIHMLYGNMTTLQEYEKSFVAVTNGIEDAGYIAALQSTIVENSRCLILFGGNSNFQRNLLTNYLHIHSTKCVIKVCYIE